MNLTAHECAACHHMPEDPRELRRVPGVDLWFCVDAMSCELDVRESDELN